MLHDEEKTNYNIDKIYNSNIRHPTRVENHRQMNVLFVTIFSTDVNTELQLKDTDFAITSKLKNYYLI